MSEFNWYLNAVPSVKNENCYVYEVRKLSGELVAWVQSEKDSNVLIAIHEMHELLKEVEFVEAMEQSGDMFSFCPICNVSESSHKRDCRLKLVLDELKEV